MGGVMVDFGSTNRRFVENPYAFYKCCTSKTSRFSSRPTEWAGNGATRAYWSPTRPDRWFFSRYDDVANPAQGCATRT